MTISVASIDVEDHFRTCWNRIFELLYRRHVALLSTKENKFELRQATPSPSPTLSMIDILGGFIRSSVFLGMSICSFERLG